MFYNLWLNAGKICRRKFFFSKMNPFTVFFKDFDQKLQDPFLKSHRDFFSLKHRSGAAFVTHSVCNTLGINIVEQCFYAQQ